MAKSSRDTHHRRLRCEDLEDRRLLSSGTGKVALSTAVGAGNWVADIAVDSSYVYWAEGPLNTQNPTVQIKRVSVNGGSTTVLASLNHWTNDFSVNMVLDNTYIYLVDGQGLYRLPKTGGSVELISDQFGYDSDSDGQREGQTPFCLAIDPTLTTIYVANYTEDATGSIQMISKTGGAVTTITDGLTWACGVATTTSAVYWAADRTVAHAPLSGGAITTDCHYSLYPLSTITADASGTVSYTDSGGNVDGIRTADGTLIAYAGNWWNECPRGIAGDKSQSGNVFYTADDNMIRYVPKKGLAVQKQLVTGLSHGYVDIYVSGNYLYYSEGGTTPSINKIPIPAVPSPSFSLTAPSSGTFSKGQNVSIRWTAANTDAGSTVSLCYDTDTTWNGNEKWIAVNAVAAADGSATYTWNTAGVAPGAYYIAGYLWSGGKAYRSHLTTAVTVKAPTFTLTYPTSGSFASGQNVAVQWNVTNLAMGGTISLCYDKDTTWNGNEKWIEVDKVTAANGKAGYVWNTAGIAPGSYYVAGYLWSGGKAYKSHLTTAVTIKPPTFTLTSPTSGAFVGGQDVAVQWNVANLGTGGTVSLCYDKDTTWNGNEKWIEIDKVTAANGKAGYVWNTAGVATGTYYIGGYLWSGGNAYKSHLATSFTVKASTTLFMLTGPTSGATAAGLGLPIAWTAGNVAAKSTISLCYDTDTTFNGNEHWIEIDAVAAANGKGSYTWDTTGVTPGTYYVGGYLYSGGKQFLSHLTQPITVVGAGAGFESHLIVPAAVSQGSSKTIYVEYSNQGNATIAAPLLMIGPATANANELFTLNSSLAGATSPRGYSGCAQVLASGQVAGVLSPKESVTVPIYFYDSSDPVSNLTFGLASYNRGNTSAVGWSSVQASLQPAGMSTTAWNALFSAFTAQAGTTWGDYVRLLDNNASYLGQLGERVIDAADLWQFALAQADGLTPTPQLSSATDLALTTPGLSLDFSRVYNEPISSRNRSGPLGYGWRDNWQYSLAQSSDGTISVTMPSGAVRSFVPTGVSSTYAAANPGDYATLQAIYTSGTLTGFYLIMLNGQQVRFNANGRFAGLYDASLKNGIVAGYNASGQMTSLTQQSSGKSLSLSYYTTGNGAGLISSVAGSDGRTVNYSYDASGHLISVKSYDGQSTTYSYDGSSNATMQNALTAITPPGGPTTSFTYTAAGRLSATAVQSGQSKVSTAYSYSPGSGRVKVSAAAGSVTQYFFDARGLLLKTIDPLGNVSTSTYDSNNNLLSATGPTGLTATFTYDSHGNMVSSKNAAGQTVAFAYGSLNRITSITDAKGNTTTYAYDASGNLLKITDPSGAAENVTCDAGGNPLTLLNPKGQTVVYTYDSAGQPTKQTLADGSVSTFAYDSHGNLTTAVDSTGTTTLSYDSGDRLTKIVYPTGRFLAYTYDNAGRRTKMVDQSGFTVNYAYNALGLLSTLTDGTGATIIAYTYNSLGQLAREDKGNGAYTTYQYDADGNVWHLVNYSSTGTVDSRFDYAYNALGQQTSMTTLDGAWTYGYDVIGELTSAVFVSSNPAVSNQNLAYTYDANGNRTQTVVNGATTSYTTNNLNQYTKVGNTTYQYDKDGNLVSSTANSVTTTYTYDSLDRLVGMTAPTDTWVFSYDALGSLAATTHNGQLTTSLIDPTGLGNVVGTYSGSGASVANYTYGLELVSQVTAGTKDYYDFDALGSTVGLTGPSGAVLSTYSYLPFGGLLNSTGTTANPFTFVGQWGTQALGNGLDWMGARFYDSSTGRFTSRDPLNALGGGTNLYHYAGNNPITNIDPSGLQTLTFGAGEILEVTLGYNPTNKHVLFGLGLTLAIPTEVYSTFDKDAEFKIQNAKSVTVGPASIDKGSPTEGWYAKGHAVLEELGGEISINGDGTVERSNGFGFGAGASVGYIMDVTPLIQDFCGVLTSLTNPPSSDSSRDSETNYDSSGNVLAPAIGVSTQQVKITATANSTSVMTNLTVINNGAVGSTLAYRIQGSLSGGSIGFSKQPSNLEHNQTDDYVVTMNVPGGFKAGQTYNGTIVVSTTDPSVSTKSVTIAVTITVPAPAAVISASPNPLKITVAANSTSASAGFTVKNAGPQGSTLAYSLQGSLSGGQLAFSKQPSKLASGQSDAYTVTMSVPGGFKAGQTYNGSIVISSTDDSSRVSSVTVPVTVTVQADPLVGHWSGTYANTLGDTFPLSMDVTRNSDGTYSGTGSMVAGIYNTTTWQLIGTINDPIYLSNGHYNSTNGAFTGTIKDGYYGSTSTISATITQTMNGQFTVNGGKNTFTLTKTSNLTLQLPDGVASSQLPAGTTETLTQNVLAPIVAEAIARWQAACLPAQDLSRLAGLNVQIVDLPGPCLGVALPDGILIDKDAAGYGWFVDLTPNDDDEFTYLAANALAARSNTAADGRADLLTTVMHEMGHVLGYADDTLGDLMDALLPCSVRRTPAVC
jgi:RHS repeat-associated protein